MDTQLPSAVHTLVPAQTQPNAIIVPNATPSCSTDGLAICHAAPNSENEPASSNIINLPALPRTTSGLSFRVTPIISDL
nr:MAG TPA: hypothetical protein [Caudoviricetes sp.]DAW94034.1 MAG TPA: hypothetical protein [Caudoviricetes sp.]